MAISLRSALVLASVLAVGTISGAGYLRAQEEDTPAQGTATDQPAAKEATPEEAAANISDRLIVRVGATAVRMRTDVRGTTIREESQMRPFRVEQIDHVHFNSTNGAGFKLELEYKLDRGFYLTGDFVTIAPGNENYTDSRDIGNFNGRGDFNLATFASEYEADYFEWSIGGGKRVYPWKPREDTKIRLDLMLQYRKSEASYTFDAGEIVNNPFDPNAFFDPRFDPLGLDAASYDTNFETLMAGVRLDINLTQKLKFEGTFAPTWFGRYRGDGDFANHGIVFVHDQISDHLDPVFHTKNCDSDDPPAAGTPPCQGLVDADLKNPSLKVEQKSNRARGLRLDLNIDYRINDAFGLRFGYLRQDFRSVGGDEKRIFGNDAAAGCPGPPDPNNPPTFQGAPNCPDESGALDKAATVTQGFTVFGRFSWF